jgi:hypothetical protein
MFEALARPAIGITVGVLAAIAMVLVARRLGREMLIYGVGLLVAALIYLAFGLQRGAPAAHLGLQLAGVLVFGAVGVLGIRRPPALLAFGWTAHALWDLFLHYDTGPAFAPVWYAMFCAGIDIFIGGYIAGRIPAAPPVRTG